MRTVSVLASLLIFFGGCDCGDNQGGDVDATEVDAAIDGPSPDANCPVRAQGQVGGPCTTDAECGTDGFCLRGAIGVVKWPDEGFCINHIDTCTADADCGEGNVCVDFEGSRACFPACGAGECACANGQLCGRGLAGGQLDKNACVPGNPAAVDSDPCTTFAQCSEGSICRDDALEHPGGECMSLGCTIGNNATCAAADSICIDPQFVTPGTGCVEGCTADADCRVAEGYRCFDGGAVGRYCRHPKTGDPCAADADCGDAAVWQCRTGAEFPGGYCTPREACNATNGTGCSSGSSVCYDPPGNDAPFCVDRCADAGQQSTCRTGYTCSPMTVEANGCI
ncbi:MAG TPA: hypothetical protein VM734_34690 [Kofleriaceae bacterium]|jgi:hypothetical protein|nr:hypothetical protein [Kofleriaceae bacterium]